MSGQVDENGKTDLSVLEDGIAWTANNSSFTHTVGTAGTPFETRAKPKPGSGNPNGAGIFDMSGNVLEFVWDWFGNYKSVEAGTRATGPVAGSQRVSRGGSWSLYTPFLQEKPAEKPQNLKAESELCRLQKPQKKQ